MSADHGEPLAHNRFLTAGIWRAATPEGPVVVKRLQAPAPRDLPAWDAHWTQGADRPRHWNYWQREALAYEHGLVDAFREAGIRAPACRRLVRGDDHVELWLEAIGGRPGDEWTIAELAGAATALGRGQARYLAGASMPSFDWLSQHCLRDYSTEKPVDWRLLDDDQAWNHPLVRDHYPTELRAVASELHAHRHTLLAIAEALPRTLCHLDFWPKNLLRGPDGEVVLIDWGLVGDGCVGEDIGNLVPDTVFDHFQPAAALPELDEAVLDGYLGGLRDGGWPGAPDLVRLGMWASAVKYDWLTPASLGWATAERHLAYGGQVEVDPAHRYSERGAALLFAARRGLDALVLADRLGFAV